MNTHNPENMSPLEKQHGPVVGTLIIIIVLLIAAYVLFSQIQRSQPSQQVLPEETPVASSSDTLPTLEAAIQKQEEDLDALDAQTEADLKALDEELQNF